MFRIILIFLFPALLFSAEIAIIKKLNGKVLVKRNESNITLNLKSKIKKKDIIITKDNSSIGIIFDDGTVLTLGENSILKIDDYIFSPKEKNFNFNLELLKGTSCFESGKIGKLSPESVKFKIPEGVIGIRGTKFYVEVPK